MKTDMESVEQGGFSDLLRAPNRGKNLDRSQTRSQAPSASAQVKGDGSSAGPNPDSLNWLLSMLQADLGEIRDFGGTVRFFDDPNGLIIQLPNVAICPNHKMMHFGMTCPMC
jgi:hypothetical protein